MRMLLPKCRFRSTEWVFILIGLAVAVPLIFFHLGHLPLRVWDEARLAINGYEMMQNHRFFVTTYEGAPDLWNTKPPLLIWLQVLSMRCFGVNEVAFRLPSAFAVLLTCVLFYVFLRSYLKNFHVGFIQNMVLLTATGIFIGHAGKSGDYDALLMLLSSVYCLSFFLFLEKGRVAAKRAGGHPSANYIYAFYVFLSLAILTKSAAALFFLPGLFLYALLTGGLRALLMNRHAYIGLSIPLVLVGGFYLGREFLEPGYWRAVWENEFGGRLLTVIEGHREPIWFYIKNLYDTRFSYWFFMAMGGAVFGLWGSDKRIYRLTLFSVVLSGSYLLLISLAQTKLYWYDLPLYPFLSILAAIFIFGIFEAFRKNVGIWAAYVSLLCLLTPAVLRIYQAAYIPRETSDWEVGTHIKTRYLRNMLRHPENILKERRYVVVNDSYHAHHLFYIYLLRDQGYSVVLEGLELVRPGDIVLCDNAETAAFLRQHFEFELLQKDGVLEIYDLKAAAGACPSGRSE